MNINFELVETHQINKTIFPDRTLPGSTNWDLSARC